MQIELNTAMMIGTQAGTTAFLALMIRQIIKRLDKQNGRIDKLEHEDLDHLKDYHSKKVK